MFPGAPPVRGRGGCLFARVAVLGFSLLVHLEHMSNFPTEHKFISVHCTACPHSHPVPVSCGDRFCPVCARARNAKSRRRLNWIVNHVPHLPDHRWYMNTLSEPNCQDLKKGVRRLIKAMRRLRQRQYWKQRVWGGVYVVEITGRPGNWHPHIHQIVYSRYIKYSTLIDEWRRVSDGTACHTEDIPSARVIGYITKYMTKPDVPDALLPDVSAALKGVRWISPYGKCHNLCEPQDAYQACCPECGEGVCVIDWDGHWRSTDRWLAWLSRNNHDQIVNIFDRNKLQGFDERQLTFADRLDYKPVSN